jgi:hypothetical protein
MAARKKRVVKTVADESYSKLDQHSIWLNEYYKSLRRAGFNRDDALWIITTKESFPDWINPPNDNDIRKHLEEEDE